MTTGSFRHLRRPLALLALLGTLSGAVAPVCAATLPGGTPAAHCGATTDTGMPGHQAPKDAPAHHHALMVCASGVCVSLPFASATLVAIAAPSVTRPSFAAAIPASATPQVTTPPPRS